MKNTRTDIENLIINYPLIELKMIANKEMKPYGNLIDYSIDTIKSAIEHYYDNDYSKLRSQIVSEACRGKYSVTLTMGNFSSFHSVEEITYMLERGLVKEGLVIFDKNITPIDE